MGRMRDGIMPKDAIPFSQTSLDKHSRTKPDVSILTTYFDKSSCLTSRDGFVSEHKHRIMAVRILGPRPHRPELHDPTRWQPLRVSFRRPGIWPAQFAPRVRLRCAAFLLLPGLVLDPLARQ